MKTHLMVVGKTKTPYWKPAEQEYLDRLRFFTDVEYTVIKPRSTSDSKSYSQEVIECEGEDIIKKYNDKAFTIAFDEQGQKFTSPEFAELIGTARVQSGGYLACIIGGTFGLADTVKQQVDIVVSLSTMTFTHEQARVFAWEQLYRAFMILNNRPYHY